MHFWSLYIVVCKALWAIWTEIKTLCFNLQKNRLSVSVNNFLPYPVLNGLENVNAVLLIMVVANNVSIILM